MISFSMKEVCLITGGTRDQINKLMRDDIVAPSVKKSSGRGSSSNRFGKKELYKIAMVFDLIKSGWSYSTAIDFLKVAEKPIAILDESPFERITNCGYVLRLNEMRAYLYSDIEKFFKTACITFLKEPENTEEILENLKFAINLIVDKYFPPVELYLVFGRLRVPIGKHYCTDCLPAIDKDFKNSVEIKKGKQLAASLEETFELFKDRNDLFILNFGKIMTKVDEIVEIVKPNDIFKDDAFRFYEEFLPSLTPEFEDKIKETILLSQDPRSKLKKDIHSLQKLCATWPAWSPFLERQKKSLIDVQRIFNKKRK